MEAEKNKIDAYIAFIAEHFNLVHVEIPEGVVVVKRSCGNCRFYKTTETKFCFTPSSIGCWKFKYKLKGEENEDIDN